MALQQTSGTQAPPEQRAQAQPVTGRYDGSKPGKHGTGTAGLTLGALGVVFGDIGTSPLYALQTVFTADHHAVKTTAPQVYGVISLVFWAIMIIVSVKYVSFIMRASNDGEGGIMALTALLKRQQFATRRTKLTLITLGLFGASLFYGDGIITPAISVLSAVEGLKVASPSLGSFVVPIALTVLTVLFVIQRYGTGLVGKLFGPVMALWFVVLAMSGGAEVIREPAIIKALSPLYGLRFLTGHGLIAFIALASVVLAITGAEALYADMGHFGATPIRLAWFALVLPCLVLNYLGQGALIVRSPQAVENPFFLLLPSWAQLPMVLLATVATVIASQAVISGAFSVSRQAVQLGVLPPITIRHTSQQEVGQVYAPAINWGLYAAVVALVLGFGSSAGLASAYGIAVTGTFLINTALFLAVMRTIWKRPWWLVALVGIAFGSVEVAFFTANLTKIVHGGWLPIVVAGAIFVLLLTWQRGRIIVTRNRKTTEGSLREFVASLKDLEPPVHRVPGTAVFLNASTTTTPLALRVNVEHNHTLHEHVLVVSVEFDKIPHIPDEQRLIIDDLGDIQDGMAHVTARFGYQDAPDVPRALRLLPPGQVDTDVDVDNAAYFLSRMTLVRTDADTMPAWQKRLFLSLAHNASNPTEYFGLPTNRSISMGAEIDL